MRSSHFFLRTALAVVLASAPLLAVAHDYQAGELHIAHPSSRATPPRAPNGVAYLIVHHRGNQTDRLVSARTPRAERVQLHQSSEKGGMASMAKVELPLAIEPGGELKLEPGGYHFMLMGIKKPLKAGERVPLTLTFEKAGSVDVELAVEGLGEQNLDAHRHKAHSAGAGSEEPSAAAKGHHGDH